MATTTPQRDPRRNVAAWVLILIYLLGALWALSGCSVQERAARKVRWAQVHAPELFTQDTQQLVLPGDTLRGTVPWSTANVDSVAAACAQLAEALSAERELYSAAGMLWDRRLQERAHLVDSLRTIIEHRRQRTEAARNYAVQALRGELCTVPPLAVRTDRYTLDLWLQDGALNYRLELMPDTITTTRTVIDAQPEKPWTLRGRSIADLFLMAALTWTCYKLLQAIAKEISRCWDTLRGTS